MGLDVGQRNDPAAIAVIEKIVAPSGSLRLRFIERALLGTPYPEIVRWVRTILRSDPLDSRCDLGVDATGMGAPVVDMLKRADLTAICCP